MVIIEVIEERNKKVNIRANMERKYLFFFGIKQIIFKCRINLMDTFNN